MRVPLLAPVRRVGCRRGGRGQATVEFALVLPLLLLMTMLVLQVALVVRDQVAVVHAAREAARAASVDPDPRAAVTAARRTLDEVDVELRRPAEVGESLRVEVRYRSSTNVPLVGPLLPDPELSAHAVMRVER